MLICNKVNRAVWELYSIEEHTGKQQLSPERLTLQASYAGDSNSVNLIKKKKVNCFGKEVASDHGIVI